MSNNIYDYIVIGSGFGGSVSAMRLSQKGYSVAILEMGKRYRTGDFGKTNWNIKKFIWFPQLLLHGIQKITVLKDVMILGGVGVGGGSLVYANTLLEPHDNYYNDPAVKQISNDWKSIMSNHYQTAKKMLGVTKNIYFSEPDNLLKEIAKNMGRENTWHSVNVGVYFGQAGVKHKDPYFNGEGPERTGCIMCGGCMIGCNHGAKNTLDKNYLFFAEKYGTEIIPERKVESIKYDNGIYEVSTLLSTTMPMQKSETYYSKGVIVSAGVLGTLKLLLKCKKKGFLPNLSNRLGESVRTNSESLTGTVTLDKSRDWSKGIAITSGFYPSDDTHIEVVRYPEKSDFMVTLTSPMVDEGTKLTRPLKLLSTIIKNPINFIKTRIPFGWAKHSIIFLVMQTIDNKIKIKLGKFGQLTTDVGDKKPPSYISHANNIASEFSKRTNGLPQSSLFESVLDMPTTAHILGGCSIANNEKEGVVDIKCEAFNYPNLHIIDGSIIPANLGVNPSLTITAMAEQAMSHIPEKSEREQSFLDKINIPEKDIIETKSSKKGIIFASASIVVGLGVYYYMKKKK
jgi:cholesterol oxidase